MLRFGYLDADLDLAVDNLDFINVLTGHLGNFSVNGAGQVQGTSPSVRDSCGQGHNFR